MFRADWDRRAGVRLPLTLPGATATAGALSPNGAFAASVEGSYVQLAESSTGSVRRIQLPKEADSQHLAIKNDGGQIALTTVQRRTLVLTTSSGGGMLQIESRPQPDIVTASGMPTLGLFYDAAGAFIVRSYGASADVIDAHNGHIVGRQLHHNDIIRSAGFSPDGDRVVTSSRDGTVRVWNARSGEPIATPLSHREATVAAAFAGDANRVITASRDGLIWSWDVASQQVLSRIPLRGSGLIGSAAFDRVGARVATTNYADSVRLWDTATGLPLTAPLGPRSPVVNVSLSEDGTRLLTVGGIVSVWDLPAVSRDETPVLSKFAEAVAGLRVIESGGLRAVDTAPAQLAELRKEAEQASGSPHPMWNVMRWFFADPWKRTISPFSTFALDHYAASSQQNATNTEKRVVADKPFAAGGNIHMQLDGGAYEVRAAADDRVRVTLSGNTGDARVELNASGTQADVAVKHTPHNNFHATIEVPKAADLIIRLSGGDLMMAAITGNKDVESYGGDITIAVGDPNDYSNVDASVKDGDIDAGVFGGSKSGLLQHFTWSGAV